MSKRALIVEDEPNIVESLTFLLCRAGFEVSVETDGQKALTALLEKLPDVLVLDVMLPGLDGFSILRRIRDHSSTQSLPVVVLSAKGQREDQKTAIESGADQFITKPFSNEAIVTAVKQLAEGRPG